MTIAKSAKLPRKSSSTTTKNMKMLLRQPLLLLTILMIFLALILFILFPVARIIMQSLSDKNGAFSLAAVTNIFTTSSYLHVFWNSIRLALIVAVVATIIGYLFAFTITRTEVPCKPFLRAVATFPIVSPPFVLSLSIIFLFGRMGLITHSLLHIDDSNVYGLASLVIVQSMSFFPTAFLTLVGILGSIDESVENAALNLGSSRWHVFRTVTLPLSMPGIGSAMLLVFIQSLEDFSNPAVIAGNYSTLAVEAYRQITGMFDLSGGSVLALLLLLPTLIAYLLKEKWLKGKSFVSVTGKPSQKTGGIREGHIVWPLFTICMIVTATIILFYGVVLIGAFVRAWGVNYQIDMEHFNYVLSLGSDALWNTVILAIIATPITGLLGIVIAYLVVRKDFIGKRFMEFSSMLSFAIPGTVIGIGYVLAFNQPPILLTGTAAILVISFVFRNIPVSIESGTSTLMQIDRSIEEASTILGANSGETFRNITLPMLRQAFFSGLVFSFVRAMTAVSSVIFLVSPRWSLATTKVFSLFESSQYSDAAAYIIVMIVIIMIAIGLLNLVVLKLTNKKFMANIRGAKK